MADVQRDPELLRAHAREADDLAAILAAALDDRGDPGPVELAVVQRAVGELVGLGAVLRAAARIEDADSSAQQALHRALRP